jgi:hypothetical protein
MKYFGLLLVLVMPMQVAAQVSPAPHATALATPTPLPGSTATGPTVDVTSGDEIGVVLLQNIGSRISNEGDTFAVETVSDYYFQGKLILPKGTPGYGLVTHVKRAGLFHAGGELSIAVKRLIAPDGRDFNVEVQGATGDANKDTEVNGNSFGQYLMWGFAGLFTKKGNDILLKKGAQFHVETLENSTAVVVPYGTKPATLDMALVTASDK